MLNRQCDQLCDSVISSKPLVWNHKLGSLLFKVKQVHLGS